MYNQFLESIMANLVTTDIQRDVAGPNGPLNSLEQVSEGLSILRYPKDLASPSQTGKNNKNHWVTFTIRDIEPAAIGSSLASNNVTTVAGVTKTGALAVTALAATVGGIQSGASGFVSAGVQTGAASAVVDYIFGGKGLTVSPPIGKSVSYISLYMPNSLNANYSANYEEMSLTSDLGSLVTTLRAIGSMDKEGLTGALSGIGNNVGTDPATITAVTGALQAGGVDLAGVNIENIGTLLQRASGYAINPQLQMIYKGTGLRSFDLEFTFTPISASEANDVNNIIQQFRFYSSPTLGQSGFNNTTQATTDSMYLIPPAIFNVQFYVNGIESPYLAKYGDCILESVQVNYAPNGFAAFVDGSMVQTQLSLSFKEMNILTRDNFNDGDPANIRR